MGTSVEHSKQNRIRFSLGLKLWLPFVVGWVIAVIVLWGMVILNYDRQRKSAAELQQQAAAAAASRLAAYTADLSSMLRNTARSVQFLAGDPVKQQNYLLAALNSREDLYTLSLVGADGVEQIRIVRGAPPSAGGAHMSQSPAFQQAMLSPIGQDYFGPVYLSSSHMPFVHIATTIHDESGAPFAVLIGEVKLASLSERIRDQLAQTGLEQTRQLIYVVDSMGKLIAYPEDPTASPVGDETLRDLGPKPEGHDVPEVRDFLEHPIGPRDEMMARPQGLAGVLQKKLRPVLAYHQPVQGVGWGVIVEVPQDTVYGPAVNLLYVAAVITLILLSATAVVTWLINYRVLHPLHELRQGASALASGQLAHRIAIDTRDEIEVLAAEFNTMAGSLQRSQEQLAAFAQEKVRQAEDAQRRIHEMTTLLESGRAITSLDLEDVLDRLAAEVARAVSSDQCLIFLKDAASSGLVARGAWGLGKAEYSGVQLSHGEGIAGWVMAEGRPLFLADAQADQRFAPQSPTDRLLSSILAVPLAQEGQIVGVLQVARRSGATPFALEDQPLLLPFAQQAGAAWKNAQLYEEERRRSRELGLVAEIARAISASLDLEATLNAILVSVREMVPYDMAEICLWEPGESVLRRRALRVDSNHVGRVSQISSTYTLQEGLTGWIARHREPLLIEDLLEEKRAATKVDLGQFPIRSHVGVPLLIGNELVGTLELASYTLRAFTPRHVTTLQMVASQAAVAIQNARLFQETRRRVEQMAILHDAAVEISSHLGLGRILHAIVERAVALLGAQGGALFQVDVERQSLIAIISFRVEPDLTGMLLRFGDGLAGRAAQKRQPMIVNDYRHWEGRVVNLEEQFTAAISVPLIWQDELVGVLDVWAGAADTLRRFGDDDLRLLSLFASQAAVAMQNANLYEQVMRRVEELSALADMTRDIVSELDPDRLLEMIVQRAVELLHATGGSLHRYNLLDQTSRLVVGHNLGGDYRGVVMKKGEGLAGKVLESQQPLIVNEYQTWEGRSPQFAEIIFTAMMGVPLVWQDQMLGVLVVGDDTGRRIFNLNDLRVLTMLAAQASVGLQNADLYQEMRRRVTELNTLTDIARALSSTLDVDELVEIIYQQLQRVMEAHNFYVALYDHVNQETFFPFYLHEGQRREVSRRRGAHGLTEYIILTGKPLFLRGDVEVQQRALGIESIGPSSLVWLGVPMIAGQRVVGMMSVQHYQNANAYDEHHLELLQAIANQAAIALENARLYQLTDVRLQQRVEELTALTAITRELNSTLDRPTIFNLVLEEASKATGADYASIYLLDVERGVIARQAIRGYTVSLPETQAAGQGIIGQVIATGQPAVVNDVTQDANYLAATPDVRSELCVPISYAGSVVGAINLESPQVSAFHDEHARFVSALSSAAAIAIGNAQLLEEQMKRGELLHRRAIQMTNLFEIGQAFRSNLPLESILDDVAHAIQETVGFEVVIISLLEGDPPVQRRMAAAGVPIALFEQMKAMRPEWSRLEELLRDEFRISQSYYFPMERREAIASLEIFETSQLPSGPRRPGHWHPNDLFLLPLRDSAGRVLGLISVDDPRDGRIPDHTTIEMLELFGNQTAVAIENSRLYAEMEQHVAQRTNDLRGALDQLTAEHSRVETLFRITSELSASLDLDRVLNRALSLVITAIGAPRGSILLVDPETDGLIHRAALGRTPPLPPGGRLTSFRRGEGLAGWVIQKRRPAIVPDVLADDRWVKRPDEPADDYHAAMVVPLLAGDDVLGTLMLFHPQPNYFTEDHLRLVDAAARQVATSINNAELYRLIRDQAERLGSMLRSQQEEASKSQAILEAVADGVMVANAQGQVILFNAAAELILGARRDEIVGRSTDDLLGLYGAAGVAWAHQARQWATSAGARLDAPSVEQRLLIEARHVLVHVAPVTLGDEYLGTVSIFRDITKEVEADRAKSDFVSTVSHELRTPMTSIKGYADLMLLGAAGLMGEDQRRFVSIIKSNADRLTVLVNDLLDISRMEGGRVELDIKPVPVEGIVEQVATSLRAKIEEKGLQLFLNVPPDVPAVMADRDRLIQILTNLVGNAYQYTPPNGSITVEAHVADGMVQIDVADTGIGIAPEEQAKVFDRFFRSDDPAVQEFPGTGLGLAIVKSLVEMQQGRIWLQSELGKGTTFSFALPQAAAVEAKEAPASGAAAALLKLAPFRDNGDQRRVLVVEDDQNIAELICRHLKEGGYNASAVGRAEEALRIARRERPDLITLDIYLPGTDGFELLQTLKSDEVTADIPVVIVSVLSDKQQGLRLGAVDYITKPIDEQLLLDTVGRVLGGAGKVVVIDDDRDTLGLLRQTLSGIGFQVHSAVSGQRALQVVQQEKPDLVLLDLKLPGGVDGYQVLTQLKQDESTADIPVIVITGSVTDDEVKRQKVLSLGAARFLTKPFEIEDLVAEIRHFMKENQVIEYEK